MKFRPFISTCLIACAALMATLLPTTASAKQCIWNKGGYVLDVRWYRPADLIFHFADSSKPSLSHLREGMTIIDVRPPVQVDQFPVAQGRCTNTNEVLTAVISVIGSKALRTLHGGLPPFSEVMSAWVNMDFQLGSDYREYDARTATITYGSHVKGVRDTGDFRLPDGKQREIKRAAVKLTTPPPDLVWLVITPPPNPLYRLLGNCFPPGVGARRTDHTVIELNQLQSKARRASLNC